MNTRMTFVFSALALSVTLIGLTGCDTTRARVIDADKEGIVRADRIDVQDFKVAASQMLNSLYTNNALQNAPRQPAVVAFSRIINDTGEYFDTDLLTIDIVEQLQNSGKMVLKTTFGTNPRDAAGKSVGDKKRFMNDDNTTDSPDFTLIGKIIKNTASAGDVRQATYTFQLMLTDTSSGNTAWIAQRQITKQGSRPSIGI